MLAARSIRRRKLQETDSICWGNKRVNSSIVLRFLFWSAIKSCSLEGHDLAVSSDTGGVAGKQKVPMLGDEGASRWSGELLENLVGEPTFEVLLLGEKEEVVSEAGDLSTPANHCWE